MMLVEVWSARISPKKNNRKYIFMNLNKKHIYNEYIIGEIEDFFLKKTGRYLDISYKKLTNEKNK